MGAIMKIDYAELQNEMKNGKAGIYVKEIDKNIKLFTNTKIEYLNELKTYSTLLTNLFPNSNELTELTAAVDTILDFFEKQKTMILPIAKACAPKKPRGKKGGRKIVNSENIPSEKKKVSKKKGENEISSTEDKN
jgi:hypothetical protein